MNLINTLVIVLAVLAVLVAVTFVYHRMSLDNQQTWMRETLRFYSSIVDADTENQIEILKKLNSKYRSVRVTLIDPDGNVIYDSSVDEFHLENHADRKEFREALLGKLGEDIRHSESVGEDSFYFAMRVAGGNVVRLSQEWKNMAGLLGKALPTTAIIAVLAIILSAAFTHRTSQRILEPIDYYAENLEQMILADTEDIPVYDELLPFVRELRVQKKTIDAHLEELKYQSETINRLIRDAREGMILMDSELTILSINASAVRLLGGDTSSEYRGKDYLHLCRLPEIYQKLEQSSDSEHETFTVEMNSTLLRIYINRVLRQDELYGVMMIIADDSENLRLEKQRKEFTANVSHELRSPLTAINGYAELLKNGMVDADDVKRIGGTISDEGRRLSAIIDDIIKLSQFDESKVQQESTEIDLDAYLQQILAVYNETINQRILKLSITLEGERTLFFPEAMLHDVLDNLISNAVKYNRDGGSIDVWLSNQPNELRLRVADTG
ncbi:MAG TPA: histidine kinase dimerization/phospho-acceptor domain-containing protein, partial [Anaerolineaceae bacterium]|nr:histidine kinase dimerization/phospho-acceptor domain-containing protein [Anaerolineaceae bacterium]